MNNFSLTGSKILGSYMQVFTVLIRIENEFCCQTFKFLNKKWLKICSYSDFSNYFVILAYPTMFCSYF